MIISPFDITSVEPAEKPLDWIFRKKHKTHFHTRKNASASLPKLTNTPGLYDGSAEARAIISGAWDESQDNVTSGILRHVLDYLKGKDVPLLGMWTREFWGDEYTEELTPEELEAIQSMVMDRSAVVETEEPKLVQIEPSTTA